MSAETESAARAFLEDCPWPCPRWLIPHARGFAAALGIDFDTWKREPKRTTQETP